MSKKPNVFGHIKIGSRLVRCKLIRISPTTHRRTVQLMESFRVYREGMKLSVGPGEFIKEEPKCATCEGVEL